jgi:hypothetical protein
VNLLGHTPNYWCVLSSLPRLVTNGPALNTTPWIA